MKVAWEMFCRLSAVGYFTAHLYSRKPARVWKKEAENSINNNYLSKANSVEKEEPEIAEKLQMNFE